MKAPASVDPEMVTVLEIIQHCGEILSRLPLALLRQHIGTDATDAWSAKAHAAVLSAEAFELDVAVLSAEESRATERPLAAWPDDALPSQ